MLDEVQTGFFRTGPAFAFQGFGIVPDVVTLAKGMANGVPIGAIAGRGGAGIALRPGDHGSTFGGGPLATAAGLATVTRTRRPGRWATTRSRWATTSAAVWHGLPSATGAIVDVRGAGLMVGVTLREPVAADVATAALERGVVLNNIGTNIVRFLPPLVCSHAEVDTLLEVLSDILTKGEQ